MQYVRIAMKSSAVFTLILVGAVATASAQPEPAEPSGRVSYTDQAEAARPAAAQQNAPGGEVQLADPTPASHGTEFIVVGKDAGAFSQLRLAATTGKVNVRSVRIFFADGTQRAIDVDSVLAGSRDARLNLKTPREIDHITVSTEPGRGTYALYGVAGAGNLTAASGAE